VEIRADFSISNRLDELVENVSELEAAWLNGQSKAELYTERLATPLAILPIAVYANRFELSVPFAEGSNNDVCDYLNTIGFPKGVTFFQSSKTSYLPIRNLSVIREDKILEEYEERIFSQAGLLHASGLRSSLAFFTSELVDNVEQHAGIKNYWVLAQYYGKASNRLCEIVIADNGGGYKKSYENTIFEVETDAEAIRNAFEGKSSKSARMQLEERGAGIPDIATTLFDGLNGKLVIMSGKSIQYYKRHTKQATKEIELPFEWQGSMVCINFHPQDVDLYRHIH
jgi:CRISPR/Cas system CMR-associated protein Cmr5 small subunit